MIFFSINYTFLWLKNDKERYSKTNFTPKQNNLRFFVNLYHTIIFFPILSPILSYNKSSEELWHFCQFNIDKNIPSSFFLTDKYLHVDYLL
jgi:hypothetical protein